MKDYILDGFGLRDAIRAGAEMLEKNYKVVDALNVFPVPDGDTGTNMNLTMKTALKEMDKVKENSASLIAQALSQGSLMGARGNSGVILSQLFRGLAKELRGKDNIEPIDFARALEVGSDTAYNAVMRPVEGTILTVARASSRKAVRLFQKKNKINFINLMESVNREAEKTLKKTPEMLFVLKKAGVVDAGGQGLCHIYKGFLNYLRDNRVYSNIYNQKYEKDEAVVSIPQTLIENSTLAYSYCTELIVRGKDIQKQRLQQLLTELGDSLLVVGEENLFKVHIHTNHPGEILEICLNMGSIHDVKIDNMQEQYENIQVENSGGQLLKVESVSNKGVIAVVNGDGLKEIFCSIGVDTIIEGGQTMNPSTGDFVQAAKKLSSRYIYILPNNKNIIMSAEQVQDLLSEQTVIVIPSKTVTQGLAAMLRFNSEAEPEQIKSNMCNALKMVKSGSITTAVRNSNYNTKNIKIGNFIGLIENEPKVTGSYIEQVLLDLINLMVDEKTEVITLYYGADINEAAAQKAYELIQHKYPQIEVEFYYGGQPLYKYLISVE